MFLLTAILSFELESGGAYSPASVPEEYGNEPPSQRLESETHLQKNARISCQDSGMPVVMGGISSTSQRKRSGLFAGSNRKNVNV